MIGSDKMVGGMTVSFKDSNVLMKTKHAHDAYAVLTYVNVAAPLWRNTFAFV